MKKLKLFDTFSLNEENHLDTKKDKIDYIIGMVSEIGDIEDKLIDEICELIDSYHSTEWR